MAGSNVSYRTPAILLRRVNYGEADRIVTLLTPEHGKVSAIAKGVRKSGSKLAGGLELFATCDLTIIPGRRQMGTITSARLIAFYGDNILRDYDRMQLAYEAVKIINRATETVTEPEFYDLLRDSLEYLGNPIIDWRITEIWLRLRLADLLGVAPNLAADSLGQPLQADGQYVFDFEAMAFAPHPAGQYIADHIKFLRLANAKTPVVLRQVSGIEPLLPACMQLSRGFGGGV